MGDVLAVHERAITVELSVSQLIKCKLIKSTRFNGLETS